MGIVLLEAMASGTGNRRHVILPAFIDVSEGAAAMHVPVRNPVALASARSWNSLGDDVQRQTLITAGMRRVGNLMWHTSLSRRYGFIETV
jgi:hypothetical protein